MALRYRDISEIVSLIDSSSCDEFVLETEDIRIVVRRRGAEGASPTGAPAPRAAPAARPDGGALPVAGPAAAPAAPGPAKGGEGVVSAPMVGVFYRAPSPEAPPFVEVGSRVAPGDPLCVIEVMKLFTTIHAEAGGTVREIGPENAQLVEYGQMLFVIGPD